jgi:hypothetical protein
MSGDLSRIVFAAGYEKVNWANDAIFTRRGQPESLTIDSVIFFASLNYCDRIPFDQWLEGDYELS